MTYKYLLIICVLALAGCHNHQHETGKVDHEDEGHPMGVHFHKEWQEGLDFATTKVVKEDIGQVIHTVAEVMPSVGDETIVSATTDGVVKLSSKTLTEGASIGAGQVICSVDGSSEAQNNLSVQQQQAAAEYQRAKAEYDRLKSLYEDKLVVESEMLTARAAYKNAEAAYNALKKNFNGGTQTITAPRSGFVKQLMVKNGEHISAGAPIAIITQSKTLTLKAEVQSSYYNILKDVVDANISKIDRGNANNKHWTLEELGGKMLSYGRQASTESPLLPVMFEVNNVVDLVPGSFVDMYIKTKGGTPKTVAPASAVLEEMGSYFVYVQFEDEFFEKRQIEVGTSDGISTEVKSGVKVGESVVSQGAILLKMQQNSGNASAEHGHNH